MAFLGVNPMKRFYAPRERVELSPDEVEARRLAALPRALFKAELTRLRSLDTLEARLLALAAVAKRAQLQPEDRDSAAGRREERSRRRLRKTVDRERHLQARADLHRAQGERAWRRAGGRHVDATAPQFMPPPLTAAVQRERLQAAARRERYMGHKAYGEHARGYTPPPGWRPERYAR